MLTTQQVRRINYLSGAANDQLAAIAWDAGIGVLNTWKIGYSTANMARFPVFGLDCAAFSDGARAAAFPFLRWWTWTEKRIAQLKAAGILDRLLFVVVPDAIDVDYTPAGPDVRSDAAETLRRFREWAPKVRALGAPTALVVQPGMRPSEIPWELVDVVFIGGDTAWKEDPNGAGRAVKVAKALGKRVHMGRVNTLDRLSLAASWGCDSADGTMVKHGPDANQADLMRWLPELVAA